MRRNLLGLALFYARCSSLVLVRSRRLNLAISRRRNRIPSPPRRARKQAQTHAGALRLRRAWIWHQYRSRPQRPRRAGCSGQRQLHRRHDLCATRYSGCSQQSEPLVSAWICVASGRQLFRSRWRLSTADWPFRPVPWKASPAKRRLTSAWARRMKRKNYCSR